MTKILSFNDVLNLNIPVGEIIDSVKEALIAHSDNNIFLLPKITLRPTDDTFYTAMPGGVKPWSVIGNKTIQRVADQGDRPAVKGTMFLNDLKSGRLLSVMDATWLTSMRTGAVTALTAKYLAKSEVKRISIMGLGNTATATILCLSYLFPNIEEFVALDYKDHAERIVTRFPNLKFSFVQELEDLFVDADVIITALTFAGEPFVKPEWMTKGMLAIPIHMRGWQNCDALFNKVFTDDHEHIKSWMPKVNGELGAVINGSNKGRENDSETIIAYNYGIAINDIAIAKVIYESAVRDNVGHDIDMEDFTGKYYI